MYQSGVFRRDAMGSLSGFSMTKSVCSPFAGFIRAFVGLKGLHAVFIRSFKRVLSLSDFGRLEGSKHQAPTL